MKNKRYIIIGTSLTDDPRTHGGTSVLVNQMVEYFNQNRAETIFIEATKFQGKIMLPVNFFYVFFRVLFNLKNVDNVLVNAAYKGAFFLSPPILFITKLFGKKFIFREFGGDFLDLYNGADKIKQKLIDYVIANADVIFFETKYLVEHYKKLSENVYWFPNTRKKANITRDIQKPYSKKFIYIGHLVHTKGIDELLEVFTNLPKEYALDIYGVPLEDKYTVAYLNSFNNVSYHGAVHNTKIYDVLSEHDFLVLPSYKEGYPGVVIEAYAAGLPVITTSLPSIKEIVDESSGLLIEAKNVEALRHAVLEISSENYSTLSRGALEKFNDFEYESVYQNIVRVCEK